MTTSERLINPGRLQNLQFFGPLEDPRRSRNRVRIICKGGGNVIYERKLRQNLALGKIVDTQIAHGELHIKGTGHLVAGTRNPAVDVEDRYLQDGPVIYVAGKAKVGNISYWFKDSLQQSDERVAGCHRSALVPGLRDCRL